MRRIFLVVTSLFVLIGIVAVLFMRGAVWGGTGVRGIDVSHHQGEIDWPQLAGTDIKFAYIKATEGGDFTDKRFFENWEGARQAGLIPGAYHFFTLCTPAERQAAHFLNIVRPYERALPPALDLEHMGPCRTSATMPNPAKQAIKFLDIVEKELGVRPIIYTTERYYNTHLRDITGEGYWLRSMFRKPNYGPVDWLFWQYSNRGAVAGIAGPVDLNLFSGSEAQLIIAKAQN